VTIVAFSNDASAPGTAWGYARWAAAILRASMTAKAQCIHVNDIRAFSAASLPARLLRLPLLLTVRDTKAEGDAYGRHWRRAARQCTRIIALSDEMSSFVAANIGAAPAKVRTINSIVDLERFVPPSNGERAACRAALGIAEDEFAVGCIGAFREKKNQLRLIQEVQPRLIAKSPHARLHFFGDFSADADSYAADCAAAAAQLGISKSVAFHGHASDMAQALKGMDAIAIVSRREGLARAMIEGMACGLPVVSFPVCSAKEMLAETGSGHVVPMGDYAGLADALARLAEDRKARAELGQRGRMAALQRFSAELIRDRYVSLYGELVAPGEVHAR
jgi:glycosyltransferase involved in cell wall biosynthesis